MMGSPATHDLAVVIISTNEAHWLGPCLSTVFARAGTAKLDVIVVDNQSTDGTRAFVERTFPEARVVSSHNGGFGYANNRGWETAQARYGLFLNPDTEIVDGTFGELVDAMDARPEVGLAGVRQITGDGTLYPSMRRFPNAARALGEALMSERWPVQPSWAGERIIDLSAYETEQECDWTVGAFMLARREALFSAGAMDERFFLQSEEPDLCLRMKQAGWFCRHLPIMTIVHHAGKAGRSPRMAAQDAFSRRQYAYKHFAPAHRLLYLSAIGIRHTARILGPGGSDPDDARARRVAARRALRAIVLPSQPPFCRPPASASWMGPPEGPAAGVRLDREPSAEPEAAAPGVPTVGASPAAGLETVVFAAAG
jgi:N-acetylglucosaminyl-diphospho-decaprenol L-rhamnosyltransferase